MKKKRKRSEIDYHDPQRRVHPQRGKYPTGNISRNVSRCHICHKTDFEWGYVNEQTEQPTFHRNSGEAGLKVKARRCRVCKNLQFFTE